MFGRIITLTNFMRSSVANVIKQLPYWSTANRVGTPSGTLFATLIIIHKPLTELTGPSLVQINIIHFTWLLSD